MTRIQLVCDADRPDPGSQVPDPGSRVRAAAAAARRRTFTSTFMARVYGAALQGNILLFTARSYRGSDLVSVLNLFQTEHLVGKSPSFPPTSCVGRVAAERRRAGTHRLHMYVFVEALGLWPWRAGDLFQK